MAQQHETYYPKTLARYCPKDPPIMTLKKLATNQSLKVLTNSKVFAGSERDIRSKKRLRKCLEEDLPMILQLELIQTAVDKWYGSERLLKLLDIFEPKRVIRKKLDLIGPFRYAYGCYSNGGRLFWSNGTIERLNLSSEQCDRLYNYICWSDAIKRKLLTTIVISTESGALEKSLLPNVFARSTNLTSLTILNGVTNHIMRIIGLNCHNLNVLDVSHSHAVTDAGLRNLLLSTKKQRDAAPDEEVTNPLSGNICKLVLIGTEVTHVGVDWACHTLNAGYYMCFLPDTIIIRPFNGQIIPTHVPIQTSDSIQAIMDSDQGARSFNQIIERFADRKRENENKSQCIDIFTGSLEKGTRPHQIYLRTVDSYICEAYIVTQKFKNLQHITQLILPWDSYTWSVNSLPDLTELGTALPHLTLLKARIQGVWNQPTELFPHLKETYIWTVGNGTVLSFFKYCKNIQILKFNCLDLIPSEEQLNDRNLHNALKENPHLLKTLHELSLRPAPLLSKSMVKFLIKHAKKLKRLGDMESWNVSSEEIKQLNEMLDHANSKCILTVLSFPPEKKHRYLI